MKIFFGFLHLYRKKVIWICGWKLGCVVVESIDFLGVLRYLVRYLDFWIGWVKSGDFTGFWDLGFILEVAWFLSCCVDESTTTKIQKNNGFISFKYPPSDDFYTHKKLRKISIFGLNVTKNHIFFVLMWLQAQRQQVEWTKKIIY